jgi:serine phosphatase RsbU (regulator of sigma subunit)
LAEFEQTQVVTRAQVFDLMTGDRLHCLELMGGDELERRHVVTPLGLKIGRTAPADMVLADSDVSRAHCMVSLKDDELLVADLGSTNGTFIDGTPVSEATVLPAGSLLQVGNRMLRHECMTRAEFEHANNFDRELQTAIAHVRALLPKPISEGTVKADWVYHPSAKIGGDCFGYRRLSNTLFAVYLVDVASHGAGAAMHAAAVVERLRQEVPNADMARPEQVLGALNDQFQMEEHAGFYFTAWYGVYDSANRRLHYASGGHHAAYLVPPDRSNAIKLQTRNVVVGAMPAMEFTADSVAVAEGASLYLFSDGAFELVDKQGEQWSVEDFVELVLQPPAPGLSEPQRLYKAVAKAAQHGILDDDFSLAVFDLD